MIIHDSLIKVCGWGEMISFWFPSFFWIESENGITLSNYHLSDCQCINSNIRKRNTALAILKFWDPKALLKFLIIPIQISDFRTKIRDWMIWKLMKRLEIKDAHVYFDFLDVYTRRSVIMISFTSNTVNISSLRTENKIQEKKIFQKKKRRRSFTLCLEKYLAYKPSISNDTPDSVFLVIFIMHDSRKRFCAYHCVWDKKSRFAGKEKDILEAHVELVWTGFT